MFSTGVFTRRFKREMVDGHDLRQLASLWQDIAQVYMLPPVAPAHGAAAEQARNLCSSGASYFSFQPAMRCGGSGRELQVTSRALVPSDRSRSVRPMFCTSLSTQHDAVAYQNCPSTNLTAWCSSSAGSNRGRIDRAACSMYEYISGVHCAELGAVWIPDTGPRARLARSDAPPVYAACDLDRRV